MNICLFEFARVDGSFIEKKTILTTMLVVKLNHELQKKKKK